METSGQSKYDSTSMGGGKMKQLKITKRQAALMLLELCHGFLILFAIYACAVVISGHGSEPFVLVGCLLFPLNAGLFLAEKKATHFWQFGIVTLLLIGGSVMLAGSGVCGIWTGILGRFRRIHGLELLWFCIFLVSILCRIRRFGLLRFLRHYIICSVISIST